MTVTLYIVGHVVPEGLTVTVNAKATIHDLKQTVARDISIPAADFDLYLEGCVLGEAASLVAETALCEGDELLAKPSKQYEALVALKEMGLVCSAADLINKVLKSDAVARTDSEKAEVLRLMVTADPSVVNAKVALTTPLLEAVAGSLTNLASLLISYKADINATGADDIVPLHIAAQNGLEDIMELLLANGADPSRADLSGMRALSYASGEGRARGAEILLKNGVDPNAQDKRGMAVVVILLSSRLHPAAQCRHDGPLRGGGDPPRCRCQPQCSHRAQLDTLGRCILREQYSHHRRA
eukprot:TRINITY_DN7214_c0_g1_i3.p1 TRINITY_DN7214_c0_g1~~TRINITY_DN7214_c0_g1_i3.p1  ORF type:complete len:298 (+),score=39.41 TRINITY_DN7214_c0_g1_i3:520-1413(+)